MDSAAGGTEQQRLPVQPRNYLRPCLLLLLGEEPTYGYELRDKLAPLAPGHWDPGTVYRTLNTMEDDGLVRSTWERSAEGPRRRRYEITQAGGDALDAQARELCGVRDMIIDFIDRYESEHQNHAPLPGTPRPEARTLSPVGEAVG
ncbi:MAG: helix-turn-helix transcriptional regulator [Candidatus Dormibacteraeota bacterium]|uniref:Helix-turn-helix transcriptional regulator n=1 Tax=Candidatus Amunia macphersoniae TaxID=3127014 RepID=A0A934NE85_9BACT|nr:helix-turn-helix transcriptional regulator [Candidatus Dormibacteraeota bacterium]